MSFFVRFSGWVIVFLILLTQSLPAQDLKLNDLIDEALKNNPDIRIAEARAASADQRISQEASLADPVFSASYQNEGFKKYAYGESQFSWWMFSLSPDLPLSREALPSAGGCLVSRRSLPRQRPTGERDVVGRVSQAYYDLVLATKELDIIEARKPLAARLEDAALARYGAGTGSQEDVIMAQAGKYMLMEKTRPWQRAGAIPPRPCSNGKRAARARIPWPGRLPPSHTVRLYPGRVD